MKHTLYCKYCGMRKDTSQVEETFDNENIRPVALAVIELCLSEGIRQLVSQLVENSAK